MSNVEKMRAALAAKPAPKMIPPRRPIPKVAPAPPAPQQVEPPPAPQPRKVKKPNPGQGARFQKRQDAAGRLPHESKFEAVYDATAQRWTGKLYVIPAGAPPLAWETFAADSSGVWKLMAKLDALYREWLKTQPAAKEIE